MTTSASRRRAPVQARSSETVQTIFEAAARLLQTTPFDQITTSRIAEEAGVSVGALYRFYSDKQEIYDAIAEQSMADFRAELAPLLTPWKLITSRKQLMGVVLDRYIEFLDAHPAFRTLALGRHISDKLRAQQSDPDIGPSTLLMKLLVGRFGLGPGAKLKLKLRIAAETGDRLIAFAYAQPSRKARDEVIQELKEMLGRYLSAA